MSIHVALHHRTAYRYDRRIALGPQIVRLRPAVHCRTPILSYSLKVSPGEHFINWQQDPQGNYLARLVFPEKTDHLDLTVDLVAEMAVFNPFDFFLEPEAEEFPFSYGAQTYTPDLAQELKPFLQPAEAGPDLLRYVAGVDCTKRRTIDFLVDLNRNLHQDIDYLIRMEPGVQSCEETLAKRSGSCRDSGYLLVQILRHLGLAARFVSGYLIQLTADRPALDGGPDGPSADFTDLHAWTEVYLPGAGWVGLDPTSGLFAGEGHIPLACSPEPGSAAPISGALEECEVSFDFAMTVSRIKETPRVTKPYTDAQWAAIRAAGEAVERTLIGQDMRLTMGGEPTFVAIDDPDGAEWNTAALGPTKRFYAHDLMMRLRERWAPKALLHYGQGKWYPGESLPRWAFGCHWRRDGEPIWHDRELIGDERNPAGHDAKTAKAFGELLVDRLRASDPHVIPGYEDIFYYLWKERRLPVNVTPDDARLEDKEERARLARVFGQGLGAVIGYAIPLAHSGTGWVSGPWITRAEQLLLTPGDSPMGFRLPLDALPWAHPTDHPYAVEADPFADHPRLPVFERRYTGPRGAWASGAGPYGTTPPGYGYGFGGGSRGVGPGFRPDGRPWDAPLPSWPEMFHSANDVLRTALCVEPRNGTLHVFMPPLWRIEEYLDLVTAIEDTAAALGTPVFIEGYPPPPDHRLNHFSITPDPGVIEVNIHPAHDWDELLSRTTELYEEARLAKLQAEKFLHDGRHVGTGGGNHFVMGGVSPSDSPFLRRPDLLKSLLGFWHNHPSLSYLFSGLFIGPTSQHPRVDEARDDAIYELDVAFKEIRRQSEALGSCPPWMVDRILRNVLIDVTGNTHRTEFCIDKLYNPDGPGGRRGLVELRAFEMPPDAKMSVAQQLLLRAMLAWFWDEPYDKRLAHWSTALHDRFMLHHFVADDFAGVLADLNHAGFALDPAWFDPHLEFRFPRVGEVTRANVHIELRTALEPWHVLGEEVGLGGTVRYVDSSVERLQVKVRGMTDARHALSCNGVRVPLYPTGVPGEGVAGIRYKAWGPPSALHPTVPVHVPVVIDLVDEWSRRSIGGCTYNVAHPGGRSYDVAPVNAFEAESRRRARFFTIGHTPGPLDLGPAPHNPAFPMTLDLRRI